MLAVNGGRPDGLPGINADQPPKMRRKSGGVRSYPEGLPTVVLGLRYCRRNCPDGQGLRGTRERCCNKQHGHRTSHGWLIGSILGRNLLTEVAHYPLEGFGFYGDAA